MSVNSNGTNFYFLEKPKTLLSKNSSAVPQIKITLNISLILFIFHWNL